MKANEAPEKIFLEWYRIGDEKYREWCIIPKTNDEPVEYTRTDAFIEKATKWITENYLKYPSEDCTDTKKFVNDFKNALKIKL